MSSSPPPAPPSSSMSPMQSGGAGPCSPVASSPGAASTSSSAAAEKSRRYDRQLRLWGDHGQAALERAHVGLVHATAVGTECLKSLVLPGIGAFTIVDAAKVSPEDVGNNFFLDQESIGQPRAAVATRLLLEMNSEVKGDWVEESPESILAEKPDFFKSFSIVVAADLTEKTTKQLSKLLWEANIPFVIVRSYGLLSYIRLQVKEHSVVESHPDNELEDLRLDAPFPALKSFMDNIDLSTMEKVAHAHVPYLIILYKYLRIWESRNGGNRPKTSKEKAAFKELLMEGLWKDASGNPEEEENFEEAVRAVNTALQPSTIPSEVRSILDDEKCVHLNAKSEDFWIMCKAVKDFSVEKGDGLLPLRGTIPDMFSDSERYIQLQQVYREKSSEDADDVYRRVEEILEGFGRPACSIRESVVRRFCRESRHLRVVRTGVSISAEMDGLSPHKTQVASHLEQDPESEVMYYFVLRGVDRFVTEHGAVPGALDDLVEPDIGKLKHCVAKVMSEYQLPACVTCKDEFIHEVCRYGGAEIHSMASVIGACAAQEIIKLVTAQYVPINNVFIYNSMTSQTVTIQI